MSSDGPQKRTDRSDVTVRLTIRPVLTGTVPV